jgi:hypothetical protein
LGDTPPVLSIVDQSQIGSNPLTNQADVNVISGLDVVLFSPKIEQFGTISNEVDTNYFWTGPNNFTQTGRELYFNPVSSADEGFYSLVYTNEFGCSDSSIYSITIDGFLATEVFNSEKFKLYPNPVENSFTISEASNISTIYNIAGQKITTFDKRQSTFDVSSLVSGLYFVQFDLGLNNRVTRYFMKN